MAVQIGAKADSDFDDPLGMLRDCHRRIEHFLDILCVVAESSKAHVLTREARTAVEAALKYFRVGGQRHTADEEDSLFPRLIAAGGFADLDRLEHEHEEASQLHADIEAIYQGWISAGSLTESQAGNLLSATARLRDLYRAHIQIEDDLIFPKAAKILDQDEIRSIGREFRARRLEK